LLNQSQKNSKLALTRAKFRSMHSELSYGLSFAPKLQRVASMSLSGSHQPTPDPSFSLASICHAITEPPVTKIRLWASFGV